MSYKNDKQMRLVQMGKLVYSPAFDEMVQRLKDSIRTVVNHIREAFRHVLNVYQERIDSPSYVEYYKLPKRPVVPGAISPTKTAPSRTVFLPIQKFRGQR